MVNALVLYHSQEYGHTAAMARAVADGLKEGGCTVEMFNTNDGRFEVSTLAKYQVVAIGSPDYYSYIAGGLKTFLDDLYIAVVRKQMQGLRGKAYVLFYSHGGGGRVREVMLKLFTYIGHMVGEPVGAFGQPDARTLEQCRALGKKLAQAMT